MVTDNKGNQQVLFHAFDKMLNRKPDRKLPSHTNTQDLVTMFADFFTEKITTIRASLTTNSTDGSAMLSDSCCSSQLCEFSSTNADELVKLIGSSARKSSILDPLPANTLRDCFDALLPAITRIVNLSLKSGLMPSSLKTAALSPILKKQSLCEDILKNYRPISNLPMVSKCIEKVVASRLNDYIDDQNLGEIFQSAYKKRHSTETALIRVQNDILQAIDNKDCVILMLLDLSAAFDTVDHSILLERLRCRFGIKEKALQWFTSYLADRKQFVCIDGVRSSERDLQFGVPQGSVLGPILYLLYTSPLGDIIRHHNMCYHLYADDSQIYVSFEPTAEGQQYCVSAIEACLRDIDLWMINNKLKLNNDKSELLVLRARHRPEPSIDTIMVSTEPISPSQSARNIGVIFDNILSMEEQVTNICRSAFYHLRNIAKIRRFLSFDTCETLIHAFITMKLDHCNSLLYGLPECLIKRLQYVQNSAARLLTCKRKFDHITPILHEIHWLPVKYRIMFKILVLTYKAIHGLAPQYISELIVRYRPSRTLRSSSNNLLTIPKHNLKTYGGRSFSIAAPMLWNSLPLIIRNAETLDIFKSKIKTFLFKQAFN